MNIDDKQKYTIEKHGLEHIKTVTRYERDGSSHEIYFLYSPEHDRYYRTQSNASPFHFLDDKADMDFCVKQIQESNANALNAREKDKQEQETQETIDGFLSNLFGNDLPGKKKQATAKKYINTNDLYRIATGQKLDRFIINSDFAKTQTFKEINKARA